jgi:hypothetical protein
MARKRKLEQPPLLGPAAEAYFDAEGNPTDDPARAVRGEVVEYDAKSGRARRTWFFFEEVEIKWLPVSESAFLLWVLVLLLVIWLLIGFVFGLI